MHLYLIECDVSFIQKLYSYSYLSFFLLKATATLGADVPPLVSAAGTRTAGTRTAGSVMTGRGGTETGGDTAGGTREVAPGPHKTGVGVAGGHGRGKGGGTGQDRGRGIGMRRDNEGQGTVEI